MTASVSHHKNAHYSGSVIADVLSQSVRAQGEKFHLCNGMLYLHFSGAMLTDKKEWAWTGSMEQARRCRATFDAAVGCKAVAA